MQLCLGVEIFLLLRHLHDITERTHRPRHDRDFLYRLGILLHRRNQRVTDFMIRNNPALLRAQHTVLLFLADENLLNCLEQIPLIDVFPVILDRIDGCLVDHVRKIRADSTAGCQCDFIEINGFIHLDMFCMHLENGDAALEVRPLDDDAAVEAPRTKQCLVEDLRPVCRADDDDSLGRIETVHLGKQLVERLLPLLVTAAVLIVTAAADGINLIDEDDAGRILCGLAEQIADTGRADADVQLDEVRTGQGIKRHMRLSGNCPGEQSFAGAGRAHEKAALRQLRTDRSIFLRVVKEVDDFDKRLLRLILARDIVKSDPGVLLDVFLGRALADAYDTPAASIHAAENEREKHPEDNERDDVFKKK